MANRSEQLTRAQKRGIKAEIASWESEGRLGDGQGGKVKIGEEFLNVTVVSTILNFLGLQSVHVYTEPDVQKFLRWGRSMKRRGWILGDSGFAIKAK